MIKTFGLSAALVICWGAVSCSNATGPTSGPQPGVIVYGSHPVVVEAPDTAEVGAPFQVAVRTYGNGCVSEGSTQVQIHGSSVDVRPYDLHSGAEICQELLQWFDHRATVTLDQPATFEIRFIGRAMPGDSAATVVRSIVAR